MGLMAQVSATMAQPWYQMDPTDHHSVDNELAGWLHARSCGQQLDVQAETSDEWCSLGVSAGTSALPHLCWRLGEWDCMNPQQVCQ